MKRKINLESDFDFFIGQVIGSVLVLNLKNDLMFRATSLAVKSTILDYLDQLSRTDAIKVLLIVSSAEKAGREEYCKFYDQVSQSTMDVNAVHKLFHAVDDLILKIREINQTVIHADRGNVLPLFLNISLASDYRIVADNTIFQNPCLEYGLAPKGGGAFFLTKILGASRAYRMMMSDKDISADTALKLGLVDKVVPFSQLESTAIRVAEDFAAKPSRSLRCCKRLINFSFKDLREYLEYETDELSKMIGPFGDGLPKGIG
jgi:2-(1,2-epoxy-1,2-dihydrophenyl)acetyl-CoA isomerase